MLRIYENGNVSGAVKIKHWPWDCLALILNIFMYLFWNIASFQSILDMRTSDNRSHTVFMFTVKLSYMEIWVVLVYITCCIIFTRLNLHWLFYVLSFSELNDYKILQDSFHILLWLIMLRTTLLSHTRNNRNVNMLMRALQQWLVIQNSIFIQHSTVTTHLT
jgi:hypothetical protein